MVLPGEYNPSWIAVMWRKKMKYLNFERWTEAAVRLEEIMINIKGSEPYSLDWAIQTTGDGYIAAFDLVRWAESLAETPNALIFLLR